MLFYGKVPYNYKMLTLIGCLLSIPVELARMIYYLPAEKREDREQRESGYEVRIESERGESNVVYLEKGVKVTGAISYSGLLYNKVTLYTRSIDFGPARSKLTEEERQKIMSRITKYLSYNRKVVLDDLYF